MARKEKTLFHLDDVPPFLEQLTGEGEGRIIELAGKRLSFGRAQDNDVVILSESVSRNHAAIFKKAANWFIEDIGSKNGIFVNGSFHKKVPLTTGDVLQIGEIAFRFNRPNLEGIQLEPTKIQKRQQVHGFPSPQPIDINGFINSVENRMIQLRGEKSRLSFYALSILGLSGLIFLSFPRGTPPRNMANVTADTESHPVISALVVKESVPSEALSEEPKMDLAKAPIPIISGKGLVLDDAEEVSTYLSEGKTYLLQRNFQSAAKAFQFALVIDPENHTAMRGIHAAEYRISDLDSVSQSQIPAMDKTRLKKLTKRGAQDKENERAELFLEKARRQLASRSYTAAIKAATSAQKLKLKNDSPLYEEAQGIVAKARQARKEEFEPFLKQAREKIETGQMREAKNLCDEILRRDPDYEEAKDCVRRARSSP